NFIASDILTGSFAAETAVFNNTASAPNSIAYATSVGAPIPASTMTGTSDCSMINCKLSGLMIPCPEPIGDAPGMMACAPSFSKCFANTTSSDVYGKTTNPSSNNISVAFNVSTGSGSNVLSQPMISTFTI